MIQVRDAGRTLQFDGDLLAQSSSARPGASRWVEFELYRTTGGSYVVARTGQTRLYHAPTCSVVSRNRLALVPRSSLTDSRAPCPECRPDIMIPAESDVAPESPRHWAIVSNTPGGVLESLYRFDDSGTKYLTAVARRLLEAAAKHDDDIRTAYQTEVVS